jgi:hypothetical protein
MKPLRIGWGVLVSWAVAALVVVAFAKQWVELPDRWNPRAPLWPQEPPTALTPYKLARLHGDPDACAKALVATSLSFAPVPDRPFSNGCGWSGAVRVTSLPTRIGPPVVLSCPAAVSLAMWERHALQPAAEATLGDRVVAVEHFGSYACRDIGGRTRSQEAGEHRSEHATANALDVAAFVLADGRTISVARDWQRPSDDPRRRFLEAVRDGACDVWNVVLGPDYNAAHRDHFHLDLGPRRACR